MIETAAEAREFYRTQPVEAKTRIQKRVPEDRVAETEHDTCLTRKGCAGRDARRGKRGSQG